MKTIEFNNRKNMFRVLGVVGVLTALYIFRRRGGSVTKLISQGKDIAGRVRDQATDAIQNVLESSDLKEGVANAKSTLKEAASQAKSASQDVSSVH